MNHDYLLSQPYLALAAAMAVMGSSAIIIIVARHFDSTNGVLTLAVIITVSFVVATYASLIYNIQQTPLTEILIGGLATALGAVVAYWMGRDRRDKGE